jgi:hypothetical protein
MSLQYYEPNIRVGAIQITIQSSDYPSGTTSVSSQEPILTHFHISVGDCSTGFRTGANEERPDDPSLIPRFTARSFVALLVAVSSLSLRCWRPHHFVSAAIAVFSPPEPCHCSGYLFDAIKALSRSLCFVCPPCWPPLCLCMLVDSLAALFWIRVHLTDILSFNTPPFIAMN